MNRTDSILARFDQGIPFRKLGVEFGVSGQRIQQIVKRCRPDTYLRPREWDTLKESTRAARYTERRKNARADVIKKFGGKCVRCGFDDPRALQLDHVNGGGNRDRRIKEMGTSRRHEDAIANPTKYQLLCANCNWIKRSENGETSSRSYRASNRPYKKRKSSSSV